MLAIIVAGTLFGIAHIPGMIKENIIVIIIRVLGTTSVGISLGIIYIKTKNFSYKYFKIQRKHARINIKRCYKINEIAGK
jgi:hypothetical protein